MKQISNRGRAKIDIFVIFAQYPYNTIKQAHKMEFKFEYIFTSIVNDSCLYASKSLAFNLFRHHMKLDIYEGSCKLQS